MIPYNAVKKPLDIDSKRLLNCSGIYDRFWLCLPEQKDHRPFQAPDHRVGMLSSFRHCISPKDIVILPKVSALFMCTF